MKIRRNNLILNGLWVIVGLLGTVSTTSAQNDNWAVIDTMPTPRAAFAAHNIDGLIYVVSGDTGNAPTTHLVESFNPVTGEWATLAPIPTARVVFASTVANGRIYVIGGQADISSPDLSAVEVYDPVIDAWVEVAPMPTARRVLAASTLNEKIYAIGGVAGPGTAGKLGVVEVYDVETGSWDTTAADMPTARWGLSTVVANDKIYAIGGVTDHPTVTAIVEAYDPVTNSWTTVRNLPTGRVVFSASELNGKIYAIGGSFDSFPYAFVAPTVEEYDPATNEWTTRSSLNVGRSFLGTSAAHGKIYAFGGHTAEIFSNILAPEIEEYNPVVTGIAGDRDGGPRTFTLYQNYPNPFNPTTVISYAMREPGQVELKIYDLLGQEIQTIVNEFQSAGSYSVGFDAGELSSGVYLYKLQAGRHIATKKMLLLR